MSVVTWLQLEGAFGLLLAVLFVAIEVPLLLIRAALVRYWAWLESLYIEAIDAGPLT